MKTSVYFFSLLFLFLSLTALPAQGEAGQNPGYTAETETAARVIVESEITEPAFADFANLHPMVVHFPIVLLLIAALLQVGSFFFWKRRLSWAAFFTLLGGFIGAVVESD